MPERSMRSFIHAGVGARASMPSMIRDAKRGQASSSSILTPRIASLSMRTGSIAGNAARAQVIAADLARDAGHRQAVGADSGVSLMVISASSSASACRRSRPGASVAGSSSSPPASSDSPSSRAEHSMPCDSTPRMFVRRMARPPGSCAPSTAQGTSSPAAAFGAPQTIVSALGAADIDRAHAQAVCVGVLLDAFDPADHHARERRGGGRDVLDLEPRHRQGIAQPGGIERGIDQRPQPAFGEFHRCVPLGIVRRGLRELPQEAQVVLVEQAQVVDAVAQHRETVGPHAEREALLALGVDVHHPQHVRMHLPGARDLQPAPVAEAHVDLGGRLGEREERRPEAQRHVVALEESAQELA